MSKTTVKTEKPVEITETFEFKVRIKVKRGKKVVSGQKLGGHLTKMLESEVSKVLKDDLGYGDNIKQVTLSKSTVTKLEEPVKAAKPDTTPDLALEVVGDA